MSISEGTGLLISSPLPILRTTCKVTVCRRLMTPALVILGEQGHVVK